MSATIDDLFDLIEEAASDAEEARVLLYTVEDECLKLKMENAKLRGLVCDMWRIASSTQCTACANYDTCTGVPCDLKNRMRELGIEV